MQIAQGWDWGTIPAWFSAILSGGSVLLALYIILRDRKKAERADATQVVCWTSIDWEADDFRTHVHNTSDRAIHDLMVWAWLPPSRRLTRSTPIRASRWRLCCALEKRQTASSSVGTSTSRWRQRPSRTSTPTASHGCGRLGPVVCMPVVLVGSTAAPAGGTSRRQDGTLDTFAGSSSVVRCDVGARPEGPPAPGVGDRPRRGVLHGAQRACGLVGVLVAGPAASGAVEDLHVLHAGLPRPVQGV